MDDIEIRNRVDQAHRAVDGYFKVLFNEIEGKKITSSEVCLIFAAFSTELMHVIVDIIASITRSSKTQIMETLLRQVKHLCENDVLKPPTH